MQTHKTTEDLESSRDEIEDLKKELHRSKESFVKKTAELSMLRGVLISYYSYFTFLLLCNVNILNA